MIVSIRKYENSVYMAEKSTRENAGILLRRLLDKLDDMAADLRDFELAAYDKAQERWTLIKKTWSKPFTQALFATILLLQALDLHSTLLAVDNGRKETNLLILQLAQTFGLVESVLLAKFFAVLCVATYFHLTRNIARNRYVVVPLLLVILIYSTVVLNNYLS